MSVGGKVIATRINEESMDVWVRDSHGARIHVRCDANKEVAPGDNFWWQGRWCLWTPMPRDGREDVKLRKLSYSAGAPMREVD